MKKIAILGILALLVVSVVAASAYAFPFGQKTMQNTELQNALDTGDYTTYLDSFEESDLPFMKYKLTEDQFNERVVKHEQRDDHREQVKAAVESGDYETWNSLVIEKNPEMAEKITSDNFDKLQELHELKEQARELAEELGLDELEGPHRMNKGLEQGQNGQNQMGQNQMGQGQKGQGMRQGLGQANHKGQCGMQN
ncbi:hypothetical protein HN587_07120 [Candidatus Woesearchaeota archaeon]|jgi:hypothetical protein|nr:hypothetical protein [Candidatus Woesearchaeota archaeon]